MANHGVLINLDVMATNVNSLNRAFSLSSADLDNGNVILLNGGVASTPAGSTEEVFVAATPNASVPDNLWIVSEPVAVITGGLYKNLDPNPQHFFVASGTVATCQKIKKGDIRRLTAENFSNTISTGNFVDVASGDVKFAFAASATSATIGKVIRTTAIPLSSGAPGSNRITAYDVEFTAE